MMQDIKFGTDGIRGVWGSDLNVQDCTIIGRAIVEYFGAGCYCVGRDSRDSGNEILEALYIGMNYGADISKKIDISSKVEIFDLGIVSTPLVSFATNNKNCKCGIVITASHNPKEYNGIKLFDSNGRKLDSKTEKEFLEVLHSVQKSKNSEFSNIYTNLNINHLDLKSEYISHITRDCPQLDGISVALDCSCGGLGTIAVEAFESLGANVLAYNTQWDSDKINAGIGALHPKYLISQMNDINKSHSTTDTDVTLGFAFDGDADRVVVVYDNMVVDGDSVLYNISKVVDFYDTDTIVATTLSNSGLENALKTDNKNLVRTAVGDKYIVEYMAQHNLILGGEQSGHYIVQPYACTGDGLVAALNFTKSLLSNTESQVSNSNETVLQVINSKIPKLNPPQYINLVPQKSLDKFVSKTILDDDMYKLLSIKYTTILRNKGRILMRYSGTEPKLRIMVESTDDKLMEYILKDFSAFVDDFSMHNAQCSMHN